MRYRRVFEVDKSARKFAWLDEGRNGGVDSLLIAHFRKVGLGTILSQSSQLMALRRGIEGLDVLSEVLMSRSREQRTFQGPDHGCSNPSEIHTTFADS